MQRLIRLPLRCATAVLLGAIALTASLPAATTDLTDEEVLARLASEQPRDRAIRLALEFLRQQQQDNGSLIDEKRHSGALTALGIMAHLAAGIAVHDHEHGDWMRRSLSHVLSLQEPNGYFGKRDDSRMYGHGIMTLMLAEALGMVGDPVVEEQIREALERAVRITEHAARIKKNGVHRGGWRYQPHDKDSDLSLSGWQLMSLHACQQVGIEVSEEVVRDACRYAKRLTSEDGSVGYNKPGDDHPALRGLSLLSLAIVGEEDDELADAVSRRMQERPFRWRGPWMFYRAYYDAVGLSRARPEQWQGYHHLIEDSLVEQQREDGSWPTPPGDNEGRFGVVYRTSMCVLALAVERYVLPAYQR